MVVLLVIMMVELVVMMMVELVVMIGWRCGYDVGGTGGEMIVVVMMIG